MAGPPVDSSPNRNPSQLDPGMSRIGTLKPRSVQDIRSSSWMLDCATFDRDYIDFKEVRDYVPPLGIKEMRLMAGWAKSERTPGRIDFSWLDECVDWARAQGINVYLDMSYGNPIYPGAGGAGLKDGIPSTEEGLREWDRWTEAIVEHYAGRVKDWAMWNEPDINLAANPIEKIIDFNLRTARAIRRRIPDARIHGLSLASKSPEMWERFFKAFEGQTGDFNTFVYHAYTYNPDWIYRDVELMKGLCAKYAPHATMRQGEAGCPSDWNDKFALRYDPWTETRQAKWVMRRMLGDLGHDVKSSVLHICDMAYTDKIYGYLNRKGLLRANSDHKVIEIKKAYYAVQNIASVFDDTLARVREPGFSTTDRGVSVYQYAKDGAFPLFVFWDHGAVANPDFAPDGVTSPGRAKFELDPHASPTDSFATRELTFDWSGAPLKDPVWIDLFTGAVYELPAARQLVHSRGVTFVRVPVYDSPCVLTERAAVVFVPESDSSALLAVSCDRADARYRCGETAVFTVRSALASGKAHVRLDNFGGKVFDEFDVDLSSCRRFEVGGTRETPGFLRLTVECGRRRKLWSAAFDPESISAGAECPPDFDAFWKGAVEKYNREVPIDVKLERLDGLCDGDCDVFLLSLSDPAGERVYGFLKEPRDLSKGPFPVRVKIPGAGPSVGAPSCGGPRQVGLTLNVHRYRPVPGAAKNGPVHRALQKSENEKWSRRHPAAKPDYWLSGIAASREDYFYYGVILAANRAVEWLRGRPEADRGDFTYIGGSQGGGLGLALVAVNGGFRRAAIGVPAITAHSCDEIDGRLAGWPRLIDGQLPENRAAARRNAAYFDGVNFAARITCPIAFSVGFVDTVAPPHAGYAAYNACPSENKRMFGSVGFGHGVGRAEAAALASWVDEK